MKSTINIKSYIIGRVKKNDNSRSKIITAENAPFKWGKIGDHCGAQYYYLKIQHILAQVELWELLQKIDLA